MVTNILSKGYDLVFRMFCVNGGVQPQEKHVQTFILVPITAISNLQIFLI